LDPGVKMIIMSGTSSVLTDSDKRAELEAME